MDIAPSARKHGIADEDIRHAARLSFWGTWQGPERLLLIGPDRAGRLLEIAVLDPDSDEPVVIHAMPAREKFLYRLERGDV